MEENAPCRSGAKADDGCAFRGERVELRVHPRAHLKCAPTVAQVEKVARESCCHLARELALQRRRGQQSLSTCRERLYTAGAARGGAGKGSAAARGGRPGGGAGGAAAAEELREST